MKLFSILLLLSISSHFASSQDKKNNTYTIEEAKVQVTLPENWKLFDKAGDLEDGMMQYFFRRAPIKTASGQEVHPAAIFILDKAQARSMEDFRRARIRSHESNGMQLIKMTSSEEDMDLPKGAVMSFMQLEKTEIPVKTYIIHMIHNQLAVEIILNNGLEPNEADKEIETIKKSLTLM